MQHPIYDVIIAGGGPAGCSAAIVLARSKRKILLIDEGNHRNRQSNGIHNYLTRDGILPSEFLSAASGELQRYNVSILKAKAVSVKQLTGKGFEVCDNHNNSYLCRRLLVATGVSDKIPDIPGMKELWGACIFHCPFCDGWECREGKIALYASRKNGFGMALALNHLCADVTLLTDGAYYLKPIQRRQLEALHIDVISTKVRQLNYTGKTLHNVEFVNGRKLDCNHIFVLHTHHVNDELLKQLSCRCTKKGAALTNRRQETSIRGVYVAGDASFDIHMVSTAAAEGVKAAVAIHNDLLKADNLL